MIQLPSRLLSLAFTKKIRFASNTTQLIKFIIMLRTKHLWTRTVRYEFHSRNDQQQMLNRFFYIKNYRYIESPSHFFKPTTPVIKFSFSLLSFFRYFFQECWTFKLSHSFVEHRVCDVIKWSNAILGSNIFQSWVIVMTYRI